MASVTPGPKPDTRPVNFRLPEWAIEFLAARAAALQTTKTEVVIEAIAGLRERELEALMEEGYRQRAAELLETAETSLPAGVETLPEW